VPLREPAWEDAADIVPRVSSAATSARRRAPTPTPVLNLLHVAFASRWCRHAAVLSGCGTHAFSCHPCTQRLRHDESLSVWCCHPPRSRQPNPSRHVYSRRVDDDVAGAPVSTSASAWTRPAAVGGTALEMPLTHSRRVDVAGWSIRVGAVAPAAPEQRAALVDLYIATSGSSWSSGRSGWRNHAAGSDPCDDKWSAVTCSGINVCVWSRPVFRSRCCCAAARTLSSRGHS
jgi:hypothetical protein